VSWYQKGKTNLHFTEARDSEWQWNPLGHMHVCTSLQTDNHASTPPLCFLQARCPSCRPTNQQCQSTEGNSVSRKLAEIFNLRRNLAYPDVSHIFCLARFILFEFW